METQKNQYFRYYRPKTNHSSSSSKPERLKLEKKKNEPNKLLPHISEEYHFRITNHLLLKKIISPKRDKLIMQSLESVCRKLYSSHSSASSEKWRSTKKLNSMHNLKNKSGHSQIMASVKSRSAVNTEHRIRRKLHVNRSTNIPENGQTTSIVQNQIIDDTSPVFIRVNRPSKVPIEAKQNHDSTLLHGSCFLNPPGGFGSGATIMRITHLSITSNPVIKGDCLIQLQLIERPAVRQQFRGIVDQKPQKTVKTNPFKYCQLPNGEHPEMNIKFALNRGKIGDFVPLRIWKYTGLQCILVGTVDLALVSYDPESESTWEFKKDDPMLGRKVFEADVEKNLVKLKMHETQDKVRVKYKIYPKRFRRVERGNELED